MNELMCKMTIELSDADDRTAVGTAIHEQLRGKQDYIDNNIILNIDTDYAVELYVMSDCKELPKIEIDFSKLKKVE